MRNFKGNAPGKGWFRPSNEDFFRKYGNGRERTIDPIGKEELNQRVIMGIGMDVSPSMDEQYATLTNCFNEIMIPSFETAAKKYRRTLRIGSVAFSSKVVPVWDGFKTIRGAQKCLFSNGIINQALQPNGGTALYRAMIELLKQSANAATQVNRSGDPTVPAKITLCILTDGVNNQNPLDSDAVKQITDNIQDKQQIQLSLAYFKTKLGMSVEEFNAMAKATGFDHKTYYFDVTAGKTIEERQKNFRRFFGILSDSVSSTIAM